MTKTFLRLIVCSTCVLTISACGQNSSPTNRDPLADPRKIALPAGDDSRFGVDPPSSSRDVNDTQNAGPFAEIKPLEIKPGGSLGLLGLNLKPLLVDGIKDTDDRLSRLEGAIIAMQQDLKTLAPSMQRMAVIEGEMQDLVTQLDTLLQEETGATTMAPQPLAPVDLPEPLSGADMTAVQGEDAEAATQSMQGTDEEVVPPAYQAEPTSAAQHPATAPPVKVTPPSTPPPSTGGVQAVGLRLGDHPDSVRIVVDLSGKVDYRHDLDNGEKILVIELDKVAWAGGAARNVSSPLVQSWSTQAMENGGTRIILVLTGESSVMKAMLLPPEAGQGNFRLLVDLRKP